MNVSPGAELEWEFDGERTDVMMRVVSGGMMDLTLGVFSPAFDGLPEKFEQHRCRWRVSDRKSDR